MLSDRRNWAIAAAMVALAYVAAVGQYTPPGGGGGGSGTVTSVTVAGTAGQVATAGTCSGTTTVNCTLSAPPAFTTTTFSATPTFAITNTRQGFTTTLTGNVTSASFSGTPVDGQEVWFRICQDATGSRTFVYPAAVSGFGAIDGTANACTTQPFRYIAASTSYVAIAPAISNAAGAGLITSSGVLSLPTPPATLPQTVTSGTAALPTAAVASNSCSASASTFTATGAATTDAAQIFFASDPTGVTGYGGGTAGGITVRSWFTSNTLNIKLCNETGSSITPGALSVNWRLIR